MPDKFSPEIRSKIMSHIRSKNTKPELNVRRFLWHMKFRYRIHYKIDCGEKIVKPDIAFPKDKIAIFVDGCFWHGCPKCYKEPKSNVEFWRNKINRNRNRDKLDDELLRNCNWKVIRIWEHSILENFEETMEWLVHEILSFRKKVN